MEDFTADSETTETNDGANVADNSNVVSDEIKAAFKDAYDAGKDEDSVKIEMISAGAKFKQVTRIYNELMVEFGYAASKEEKEKAVSDACEANNIAEEDGFDAAVKSIVDALENVNERGAGTMIRAYAKKNDMEFFKKPKSAGGGNRTTFISDYYDALVENPNMTEEEAHDFIVKNGTPNTLRWERSHQKVRELCNRIAGQ